ncbi:hypothetical protein RhiirA4_484032 [Rhizophagus irregularis]|uniref:Uncharacterized protein n=1 Tax=Rhizophagus irregularis TaxID=588596 RepID=A0A2I1HNJ3_9GLOM|nr:hypothetical protein RhiirA4_484032 [Rhizophagus irregularis]
MDAVNELLGYMKDQRAGYLKCVPVTDIGFNSLALGRYRLRFLGISALVLRHIDFDSWALGCVRLISALILGALDIGFDPWGVRYRLWFLGLGSGDQFWTCNKISISNFEL